MSRLSLGDGVDKSLTVSSANAEKGVTDVVQYSRYP